MNPDPWIGRMAVITGTHSRLRDEWRMPHT
jgi:hypothetical protein